MRIRDAIMKLMQCTDLDAEFIIGDPEDPEAQRDVANIRENADGAAVIEIDE